MLQNTSLEDYLHFKVKSRVTQCSICTWMKQLLMPSPNDRDSRPGTQLIPALQGRRLQYSSLKLEQSLSLSCATDKQHDPVTTTKHLHFQFGKKDTGADFSRRGLPSAEYVPGLCPRTRDMGRRGTERRELGIK